MHLKWMEINKYDPLESFATFVDKLVAKELQPML